MKILIIGTKGFIGSHIYTYFRKIYSETTWSCDIVTDVNDPNYFFIDSKSPDYNLLFKNCEFDVCINCSGAANVSLSFEDPIQDFTLNTINVFKILEAIRNYSTNCKFLNLSSAAVYGEPSELPITEKSLYNPVSPYGFHKMQSEIICREFTNIYKLKTCSLRIFSAYGNGLKKQLLWDLYNKFDLYDTVELFGTGEESRDFIHIDDIVKCISLIIENSEFKAEVYNVASGKQITINEVANLFSKNWHQQKKVIFTGSEKGGDPKNWQANIELINNFGFIPRVKLEDGINQYIKWVKSLN